MGQKRSLMKFPKRGLGERGGGGHGLGGAGERRGPEQGR